MSNVLEKKKLLKLYITTFKHFVSNLYLLCIHHFSLGFDPDPKFKHMGPKPVRRLQNFGGGKTVQILLVQIAQLGSGLG